MLFEVLNLKQCDFDFPVSIYSFYNIQFREKKSFKFNVVIKLKKGKIHQMTALTRKQMRKFLICTISSYGIKSQKIIQKSN